MPIHENKQHRLDIQLDQVFNLSDKDKPVSHYAVAYGVWAGVNKLGTSYSSELTMNEISISKDAENKSSSAILFDNTIINKLDEKLDYGEYYNK